MDIVMLRSSKISSVHAYLTQWLNVLFVQLFKLDTYVIE